MPTEYVLYDIPSRAGTAWSPNTWKVRLVLNYKEIPYRTEWIEFPDVKAELEKLGIPPNPDGWKPHTVPVLKFPDGTYIMESDDIVARLLAEHPEPALPMEPEICKEQSAVAGKTMSPLTPLLMPRVRRNIVGEASDAWFKADRERLLGAPEEQYERERGGEKAWNAAKPGQAELAEYLAKHKRDDGPFILGSQVSYPDFLAASRCEFLECAGEDTYEKFVGPVKGMRELHEACKPWFAGNK